MQSEAAMNVAQTNTCFPGDAVGKASRAFLNRSKRDIDSKVSSWSYAVSLKTCRKNRYYVLADVCPRHKLQMQHVRAAFRSSTLDSRRRFPNVTERRVYLG